MVGIISNWHLVGIVLSEYAVADYHEWIECARILQLGRRLVIYTKGDVHAVLLFAFLAGLVQISNYFQSQTREYSGGCNEFGSAAPGYLVEESDAEQAHERARHAMSGAVGGCIYKLVADVRTPIEIAAHDVAGFEQNEMLWQILVEIVHRRHYRLLYLLCIEYRLYDFVVLGCNLLFLSAYLLVCESECVVFFGEFLIVAALVDIEFGNHGKHYQEQCNSRPRHQ